MIDIDGAKDMKCHALVVLTSSMKAERSACSRESTLGIGPTSPNRSAPSSAVSRASATSKMQQTLVFMRSHHRSQVRISLIAFR
jgi:hypothetical protein